MYALAWNQKKNKNGYFDKNNKRSTRLKSVVKRKTARSTSQWKRIHGTTYRTWKLDYINGHLNFFNGMNWKTGLNHYIYFSLVNSGYSIHIKNINRRKNKETILTLHVWYINIIWNHLKFYILYTYYTSTGVFRS